MSRVFLYPVAIILGVVRMVAFRDAMWTRWCFNFPECKVTFACQAGKGCKTY